MYEPSNIPYSYFPKALKFNLKVLFLYGYPKLDIAKLQHTIRLLARRYTVQKVIDIILFCKNRSTMITYHIT